MVQDARMIKEQGMLFSKIYVNQTFGFWKLTFFRNWESLVKTEMQYRPYALIPVENGKMRNETKIVEKNCTGRESNPRLRQL